MKMPKSCIALIATALSLVGCNTNQPELRDEIRKAKSITIICCDTTTVAAVKDAGMMIIGSAGGVAGRSSILGEVDSRTSKFYETAGGPPLQLPATFLKELAENLKLQGYNVVSEYPHAYDGYNSKYMFDTAKVASQLVLEVRYAGHIGEYQRRYFPTLAATFTVRRTSDNKSLNSGLVATSDPGITSPLGAGVEILRAPMLSALAGTGSVKFARLVQLDESQVVVGDDAALIAHARRIYAGTEKANIDLAKLLASRIAEPTFQ
jgi:hypothetical protein